MSALAGVRILDLTRLLPGPYASLLLAELGADVIKVESTAKPDYLRFFPPPAEEAFALLNRHKRSLLLAWDTPQGSQVLQRLAGRCDVLLESFRSGYLARFGLDAPSLLALHPGLIYCSLTGYGQGEGRAGHDLNFLARSGLGAELAGPQGPVVPRIQLADMSGGMAAAMAVLAALVERHRTGRGRHLDVALTDAPAAFTALAAAGISLETLSGRVACYRYYRCQDDLWLAVAALEEGFRERLIPALGLSPEGWLDFDSPRHQELETLFGSAPRQHWLDLLEPLDVCVEPVLQPSQVPSRGLLGASFPPVERDCSACEPGRHTRPTLSEMGLSETEIAELIAAEIVIVAEP